MHITVSNAVQSALKFFFNQRRYKVLGESCRKPGQVMHGKAWISYINKEIEKAKETLKINDVALCNPECWRTA